MSEIQSAEILRQEEAWQVVRSVDDPITSQLLSRANVCILNAYVQQKGLLSNNFDLKFFAEAMLEFCKDHNDLRKILAGEDLRLFNEAESLNTENG